MFHNYFFLKRYAETLNSRMRDMILMECFSQNKNELLLGFSSAGQEFWIKANLEPQIGLIQTTSEFKRARKNSVDLFDDLMGLRVEEVKCFAFERSFYIRFEKGYQLIFKMHASRSNVLMAHHEKVESIFRNQLPKDLEIEVGSLHQHPSITIERFQELKGQPTPFIPALGKEVKKFLTEKGYDSMDIPEKWKLMNNTLATLDTNPITLFMENDLPKLTLLQVDTKPLLVTRDPLEASNQLYTAYTHHYYLEREKRVHLKEIEAQIKKTHNYILNSKRKLEKVKSRRSYEELANIIMANLHQINTGAEKVNLFDFYNENEIEIKLNPELSPQKNAENLYRKSKNEALELRKLQENISGRERKLQVLKDELQQVKDSEDFKELRNRYPKNKPKKEPEVLPYHRYTYKGYDILVGKHAKANDILTLKIANKWDYWLHARDVAGSHVVIRHQAGKDLGKDVLERAAEIAAWFSKRKTEAHCPVIHTQKKYVRKLKGAPPGQVIVEKEDVIMVTPKGFE